MLILSSNNEILAWYFSNGELWVDDDVKMISSGLILQTKEEPIAGKVGFHASQSPLDALRFFAVRPNDRKVVSRVKLDGKIIRDKVTVLGYSCERLTAQYQHHLWVADVEETLEDFAYININKSFDWFRANAIEIPDSISEALNIHRDWSLGNISAKALNDISKALSGYWEDQRAQVSFPTNIFHFQKWLESPRLSAEDFRDVCKAYVDFLPATIARRLAQIIKRDSQFYALETVELIERSYSVICDYLGWETVLNEAPKEATNHVDSIKQLGLVAIGSNLLRPPDAYRANCHLQSHNLGLSLNNQLMSLALEDYQE